MRVGNPESGVRSGGSGLAARVPGRIATDRPGVDREIRGPTWAPGWAGSWVRHHPGRVAGLTAFLILAGTGDRPAAGVGTDRIDPWRTPVALALSPAGDVLFAVCRDSESLVRIATDGSSRREVPVGKRPVAIALSPDGSEVGVACQESHEIRRLDARSLATLGSLPVPPFPAALAATAADEGRTGPGWLSSHLYSDLLVSLPGSSRETAAALAGAVHLPVGRGPGHLVPSPDGSMIAVTSLFSTSLDPLEPPAPEVDLVGFHPLAIRERVILPGANILRKGAWTPDGGVLIVPLQRPKNLLPSFTLRGGWSMTHGLALIRPRTGGARVRQILLDGPSEAQPEPHAVVVDAGSGRVWVSIHAANRVLGLDLERLIALAGDDSSPPDRFLDHQVGPALERVRIEVPAGPRDMVLDAVRGLLYVACSLDDTVAVVDTRRAEIVRRLELSPDRDEDAWRRGQKLFSDARFSFHGSVSCNSCHPDGHQDNLAYDLAIDGLGRNRVDVRTLLDAAGTEPFKWSGLNSGFYAQCGPRASKIILRGRGFAPRELDDLVTFLESLRLPANPLGDDPELAPARERGRRIFFRDRTSDGRPIPPEGRCGFCHAPDRFTNKKSFDVGTAGPTDTITAFDTPQLENLSMTVPFLHDGSAPTLEACFTSKNPDDRHGVANDLGKDELNDLVIYMLSIGPGTGPTGASPAAPATPPAKETHP